MGLGATRRRPPPKPPPNAPGKVASWGGAPACRGGFLAGLLRPGAPLRSDADPGAWQGGFPGPRPLLGKMPKTHSQVVELQGLIFMSRSYLGRMPKIPLFEAGARACATANWTRGQRNCVRVMLTSGVAQNRNRRGGGSCAGAYRAWATAGLRSAPRRSWVSQATRATSTTGEWKSTRRVPNKLSELSGKLHHGPRWADVRGVEEQEAAVEKHGGFHIG